MATASTMATQQQQATVKRPGPPVPPRPLHTNNAATAASLLKRESLTAKATTSEHPVIQKKPTLVTQLSAVGRTLVYKSPSMNLQKRQEERERRSSGAEYALQSPSPSATASPTTTTPTNAPKPPLKLRKAPDVPTAKPRLPDKGENDDINRDTNDATKQQNNNIVIVQTANNIVNLNRHNSLSSPKHAAALGKLALKDTRLSLGKVDFERVGVGKMQFDQLQLTAQPLPRPRKIVNMPVATLDVECMNEQQQPTAIVMTNSTSAQNGGNIFRRSKTTLDGIAIRGNITTISTGNGTTTASTNSYLGGKTVEIKNNLKNAAERLFSEIIINQQHKQSSEPATIITKHERAVQHQALLEQELAFERQKRFMKQQQQQQSTPAREIVVVSAPSTNSSPNKLNVNNNCTRININTSELMPPTPLSTPINGSIANSPEKMKKTTFHEMLISELAAMRGRSCSMENLTTRDMKLSTPPSTNKSTPTKNQVLRKRYNSIEDHEEEDPDTEDVDADNVEDADGDDGDDDDDMSKTLKVSANNSPRKRCPSGCSSDSSPYGTERSTRIRTSDWIEVGDNGKQVTLTSCHISLEDSGLEDEERLDDMSSSGVGDSWDSVKEAENEKRSRSVKRVMSISGLPPLPKSLSGINKMLGSDSGLISDVDTTPHVETKNQYTNSNNNNNSKSNNNISSNKLECQKDNSSDKNDDNENDKSAIKETNGNENEIATNAKTTTTTPIATAKTIITTITAAAAKTTPNTTTTTSTTTTSATPTAPTVSGSTLDAQIATLRKEMYGLRQLDLSLLSQLWALNDSIQEFRTMLEDQEEAEDDEEDPESYARHSPTPSSYDSVSSEGGGEADVIIQAKAKNIGTIPKVITTQPKLNQKQTVAKQQQQNNNNNLNTQAALKVHRNTTQPQQKPALPKPLDVKPVPRMRSAPPPPPSNTSSITTGRKGAAPPRPT